MVISIDWGILVEYDETCPSGLRWTVDIRTGKGVGRVLVPAGTEAGSLSASGRYQIQYKYKLYQCHRVVWELHNGSIDAELDIDHIDGNPVNNKISNLRLVPHKINMRNMKKNKANKTGVTGVLFRRRGKYSFYEAFWQEDGKRKSKTFSADKYGFDAALQMATYFRENKIWELNLKGDGYSDRHGRQV